MATTLTSKGQVTIPKRIRDALTSIAKMRRTLVNLLLLSVSSLTGLLLILWALPHLRKPALKLTDYDDLVIFAGHRGGGHLRESIDQVVQGERAGMSVHWRTDANGFRVDQETKARAPPNVRRILLLGDSYIDGMRTDQRFTIGAELQRALGAGAEVIIVGHNNPANAWYWLQNQSAAWHPDDVVLGITLGNDLTFQNLGAGLQESANGGVELLDESLLDGNPAWRASALPAQAYLPRSNLALSTLRFEFHVRHWLAARAGMFGQLPAPETGPELNAPGRFFDRDMYTGLGLFARQQSAFIQASYRANRATLAGIQRLLSARGVRFTVLVLPVRIQVNPTDWARLLRQYALNPDAFDLRAPNAHIKASCAEFRIDCLDPTEALIAQYQKRASVLYRPRGDMHLNEAGNARIAAELARHLEEDRGAQ